jgi:hypothetical protein
MSSGSNLSINQLRKSLLFRNFAATCRIPPKPIPCIVVRIDGVNAVVIKDLMIEGEHRATCECAVLFAYKWKEGLIIVRCFVEIVPAY